MSVNPFDYVNSITFTKQNMMRGTENDELAEKDYNAFFVNKALSWFPDTVLYANEMNRLPDINNKLAYEYLLHSIRRKKRFAKWSKPEDDEDLKLVANCFQCNLNVAKQYLSLLSEEQIEMLRQQQEKGGVENGRNRKSGGGEAKE